MDKLLKEFIALKSCVIEKIDALDHKLSNHVSDWSPRLQSMEDRLNIVIKLGIGIILAVGAATLTLLAQLILRLLG